DVIRIEAHLPQAVGDLGLHRVVVDRVDDDDPRGRRQRPGRVLRLSYVIEVVEDLDGLGVPLFAARCGGKAGRGRGDRLLLGCAGYIRTEQVEERDVLGPG